MNGEYRMTRAERDEALRSVNALRVELLRRSAAHDRARRAGPWCPHATHRWGAWLPMRDEHGGAYETRRCDRCPAAEIEAVEGAAR